MKRALISDIHGNLEALNAVLADIDTHSIDEIYCLGDIIGYGPNPCECLDVVSKRCSVTILGNHDQAALFDPNGFNPVALQAIYWTRDQLDLGPSSDSNRRWDFVGTLPRLHRENPFLFVHGSSRDPTNEYVFPDSIYDRRKMETLFSRVEQYCFQGHTHLPGVFTVKEESVYEFTRPDECDYKFALGDDKLIVNVGSVGQPRDEDPRSCYVILDDQASTMTYRRVEYDIETTAQKIYAQQDLANMLGDRIKRGK